MDPLGRGGPQRRKSAPRPPAARLITALLIATAAAIPAIALAAPGNFTLAPTSPEPAGTAPISVTAANLNGDANMDLAVTDFVDPQVRILLGDGTGNFSEPASSPETIGSTSNSVTAGDFNADGKTDLATANLGNGTVTVLLGNGAGDFTPGPNSPKVVGSGPLGLVAAPLDPGSVLDLAVINSDSTVTIYLGIGNGDFVESLDSPEVISGINPRAIIAAQFVGPPELDLAIVGRDSNTVETLVNFGNGDFGAGVVKLVGFGPNSLATGDFNADGFNDLAVPNRGDDNVTILLGQAGGDFNVRPAEPAVGDNPRAVVAANFGGTPALDLAVANADSDNISILFGDGAGGFSNAGTSPEPTGDEPFSLATANFGGGTTLDLASANPEGGDVTILLNDSAPAPAPTAKCKGKTATVTGSANRFVGTPKRDVIAGTRNRDTIIGKGGNDLICNGGGNDLTKGGGGKDTVYGGGGRDTVRAAGGNDTVRGQGGNDKLFGQGGRDRLLGQAGKDTLNGGPKRDTCKGGPGRDIRRACERGS